MTAVKVALENYNMQRKYYDEKTNSTLHFQPDYLKI